MIKNFKSEILPLIVFFTLAIILFKYAFMETAHAMAPSGLVKDLETGQVTRVPLPDYINNLRSRLYHTTGGIVHVMDYSGRITHVGHLVGMYPDDPNGQLDIGFITPELGITNQPFAKNLACMLFEIKEKGVRTISADHSNTNILNYINEYKKSVSDSYVAKRNIEINSKLINGLGALD